MTVKTCRTCGEEKPLARFVANPNCHGGRTHLCHCCKYKKEKSSAGYAEYRRKVRFQAKYGITLEDFDSMRSAQQGLCAICHEPPSGARKANQTLHVDHCHETGKVRGLLCQNCNMAVGLMHDDPQRLHQASMYLSK